MMMLKMRASRRAAGRLADGGTLLRHALPGPLALALLLAACATGGGARPATESSADAAEANGDEASSEATEREWVDAELRLEQPGRMLPPMPTAVTSFGAVATDGHLYTLGGYFGEPHAYSKEYQSALLQKLPLDGSGGWATIGQMPVGLQGLELVAHDGRLCRVGGNQAMNDEGDDMVMRSVADASCFDLASGDWADLPALPAARSSHAAAVVGDTLWVVGGWTMDGEADEARWASTVVGIDLAAAKAATSTEEAPSWKTVSAPFERRAVGAAAAGGKLVVLGGLDKDREMSSRVDVFDPATESWTQAPDFPGNAFGIAAVGIGDRVYASGKDGMVHAWTVGADAWEPVYELAFNRFFHELVVAGDQELVAVGGIGGMHTFGRTRHVERVPLGPAGADAGGAVVSMWTLSYPGAAKNRQGWFRQGDFLYAFGGNNSLGQHDFEPENFEAAGWRLHVPSGRWQQVSDFPRNRQSMVTTTVAGTGYAIGGFGHNGEDAVTQQEVFAYDFENDAWTPWGGLPRGRTQFGLASTVEGDLWILGGLNYDPAREGRAAFDHVTNLLKMPTDVEEPKDFTEVDGVALPATRRAFAGAVLDGRYYIIGGMREGFELVDDCLAFDVDDRTFSEVACPNSGARLSGDLVVVGDALYLVGGSIRGEDGMSVERSIERYDPESNTWTVVLDALPFEPRHARAIPWDDQRLLVVSTHTEEPLARFALVDFGRR
ncbi:MAG TPA: hypothetical protein RMF84_15290 [Polyangiaceae bacterium LLY-WYZ-14_1]|nr:hypothetical protein [Polyangiaceae bacterium LLY-WYZ-14_1]